MLELKEEKEEWTQECLIKFLAPSYESLINLYEWAFLFSRPEPLYEIFDKRMCEVGTFVDQNPELANIATNEGDDGEEVIPQVLIDYLKTFDPANFSKKLNARGLVLIGDAWDNLVTRKLVCMMIFAQLHRRTPEEQVDFLRKLLEEMLIEAVVDAGLVSEKELFEEKQ